jgi:hypothetical protein
VGGGSPGLQPEGRNLGIPAWAWQGHLQADSSKWKSPSRGSADDVGDVIGGTAAGIRGAWRSVGEAGRSAGAVVERTGEENSFR